MSLSRKFESFDSFIQAMRLHKNDPCITITYSGSLPEKNGYVFIYDVLYSTTKVGTNGTATHPYFFKFISSGLYHHQMSVYQQKIKEKIPTFAFSYVCHIVSTEFCFAFEKEKEAIFFKMLYFDEIKKLLA